MSESLPPRGPLSDEPSSMAGDTRRSPLVRGVLLTVAVLALLGGFLTLLRALR